MTKRMTISLEDDIYEKLQELAENEIRTPANLAAAMVTKEIRERLNKSKDSRNSEQKA